MGGLDAVNGRAAHGPDRHDLNAGWPPSELGFRVRNRLRATLVPSENVNVGRAVCAPLEVGNVSMVRVTSNVDNSGVHSALSCIVGRFFGFETCVAFVLADPGGKSRVNP